MCEFVVTSPPHSFLLVPELLRRFFLGSVLQLRGFTATTGGKSGRASQASACRGGGGGSDSQASSESSPNRSASLMYALGRSVDLLDAYPTHDPYGSARFVVVDELYEKLGRCVDVEERDAIDIARVGEPEGVEPRLEALDVYEDMLLLCLSSRGVVVM